MNTRPSAKKRREKRRKEAIRNGHCYLPSDFQAMCRERPQRIGIVAEGDSWFSYPRKWFAFGKNVNLIHHIGLRIRGTDTANLIQLSSNGDEAVEMTSGKQFQNLYRLLKKNRKHIDIVLFSGGGNDIVGKNDMLPLLNDYVSGMKAIDCIRQDRFQRKLDAIILAYERLLDLCADLVPAAKVITHTYDIPKPEDKGAEFIWGLIKTKPWVYPYLVRRNIPEELHLDIIRLMLTDFATRINAVAANPARTGQFIVVNTQGTLRPGHGQDWLNEIHPTSSGFKRIAKQMYGEMKAVSGQLPKW